MAAFAPTPAPHLLYSYHLEHFAAAYVLALAAAAAFVKRNPLRLCVALWIAALGVELLRLTQAQHRDYSLQDWFADAGGVIAALAPMYIATFRESFAPPER